jgi:hypothetical protein
MVEDRKQPKMFFVLVHGSFLPEMNEPRLARTGSVVKSEFTSEFTSVPASGVCRDGVKTL